MDSKINAKQKVSELSIAEKQMVEIAKRQIESLGIKTPISKTPIINLLGGNRQKCIIGRCLERDPQILFMSDLS